MELLDDAGVVACTTDEVQLKVAPFVMLPLTAAASKVLVADYDPAFHAAISALAGPANVITTSAGSDVWTQHPWELGISSGPTAFLSREACLVKREGEWRMANSKYRNRLGTSRFCIVCCSLVRS